MVQISESYSKSMLLKKINKEFPQEFLWGASSSAIQVEGGLHIDGRGPSVIDDFQLSKDVCDYSAGSDHYHRYQEDVALMKEVGLKSYRFSFSWSRIFPTGRGEINPKGVAFYQNLINELKQNGIEPIPTIYHFDYPQGLVDAYGGWINRQSIEDYVAYAKFLFETFGKQVKYWLTINEQDHVIRIAPRLGLTGKEDNYNQLRYQANHNMCVASAKVFKLLHEMYPTSKIGPALSYLPIYPHSNAPEDILAASDASTLMVNYLCDLHCWGRYPIRLWKYLEDRGWSPIIEAGDMEIMKENTPDFLAVNYYSTTCATFEPATKEHPVGGVDGDLLPVAEYGIYRVVNNPNLPRTSFGWQIDSIGLRLLLEELYERYNLPVMITENGLSHPDAFDGETVDDDYRIEYLKAHIQQVRLAIETGVEVIGYHLWSFMDLTSGREGFKKRYGLVYVNREDFDLKDMNRFKKKSFYWYQELIKHNGKNI